MFFYENLRPSPFVVTYCIRCFDIPCDSVADVTAHIPMVYISLFLFPSQFVRCVEFFSGKFFSDLLDCTS